MFLKTIKTFLGENARDEWEKRDMFYQRLRAFLVIVRGDKWTEEFTEVGDDIVKVVYLDYTVMELHVLRQLSEDAEPYVR